MEYYSYIEGDSLYRNVPYNSHDYRSEFILTKDEFVQCYSEWIKKDTWLYKLTHLFEKERNNHDSI